MKEISRETNRVLSDEYILWLIRFVSKDAETDNDNNMLELKPLDRKTETENVNLLSVLFSVVADYYEKNNIEFDVQESKYYNKGVVVNLTDSITIHMRSWCSDNGIIDVTLIDNAVCNVNISDVVAFAKDN